MRVVAGAGGPGRDERQFRSVGEAARVFGVSEMTLYRAIREGRFPAVRIMGRLIVPLRAIEEMTAAAVENGVLVDAADWVGDAVEDSRPDRVRGAGDLRANGVQLGGGALSATPTAGHRTGTRAASGGGDARRRPRRTG